MDELDIFLNTVYAHSPEGVYYFAALIHPPTRNIERKWFDSIPNLRDFLSSYTGRGSSNLYLSPGVFMQPEQATKTNVAGSSVVWVDCDAGLPEFPTKPNLVLESSPDHFHAYYSLPEFTNPQRVEALNRKLAYDFNTDKSGWDSTQLLRPPGSVNRKRGNYRSCIVDHQSDSITRFDVPEPKEQQESPTATGAVGNVHELLASLVLTSKQQSLLFKKAESKSGEGRSGVLFESACEFVKMKLTDDESLLLLELVDTRLGKFATRDSPRNHYQSVMKAARVKHPDITPVDKTKKEVLYQKWMGDKQFFEEGDEDDKFIVEGYLLEQGITLLGGEPGSGKSRIVLYLANCVCCGKPFLGKPTVRNKVLYISLDMHSSRVRSIRRLQREAFSEEERELINENIRLHIRGHSLDLTDKEYQARVLEDILESGAKVIIIDVLARAVPTLIEEEAAVKFMDWIQRMVVDEGLSCILVTHTRKSQGGSKTNEQDDFYGSRQWSIPPDTSLILEADGENLRFRIHKDRSGGFGSTSIIKIQRDWKTSSYSLIEQEKDNKGNVVDDKEEVVPGTNL